MDYFPVEGRWLFFGLVPGSEGDGGGDKAEGPTCCRIISVPSHHHQSHAREDRSRAGVGAAWDLMAGLKPSSQADGPPPSCPPRHGTQRP